MPHHFSDAELAALRLDGECFALGDGVIALDQPVDASVRATSIAGSVQHHDLVAERWTAAWIHGAAWTLPRPHHLCIDVRRGQRTAGHGRLLREVRFEAGDLMRLGGVAVTSPLRTACDLARLERSVDHDIGTAIARLLALAEVTPIAALTHLAARPPMPYKRRGVARLASLASLAERAA